MIPRYVIHFDLWIAYFEDRLKPFEVQAVQSRPKRGVRQKKENSLVIACHISGAIHHVPKKHYDIRVKARRNTPAFTQVEVRDELYQAHRPYRVSGIRGRA